MGLFDAIASGIGTVFNAFGQSNANDANAHQNNLSRGQAGIMHQNQRDDANSAHQREVADLKAAGLNPILSATKGAAVGGGTAASPLPMSPVRVDMPKIYEMQQLDEQKRNNAKSRELTDAQINRTNVETQILKNDAQRSDFFGGLWKGFKNTRNTMDRVDQWRKESKNPWLSSEPIKPNKNLGKPKGRLP